MITLISDQQMSHVGQTSLLTNSSSSACSLAVSYKPPILVTRVQLPACAFCHRLGISLLFLGACKCELAATPGTEGTPSAQQPQVSSQAAHCGAQKASCAGACYKRALGPAAKSRKPPSSQRRYTNELGAGKEGLLKAGQAVSKVPTCGG